MTDHDDCLTKLSTDDRRRLASQVRCSRHQCPSNVNGICAEIEFGCSSSIGLNQVQCENRIRRHELYRMTALKLGVKIVRQ